MTAPKTNYIKVGYQNPDAQDGLTLSVAILPNTPEEDIKSNIRANSAKYKTWLQARDKNDQPAVLIGGGDSINDHIDDIRKLQSEGAAVFAMNGASKWARGHGIEVDYQVILDAKEETANLVDPGANQRLIASQCHPKTLKKSNNPILWHLEIGDVESLFPEERIKKGGYVLVGGESTVGICALCIAYVLGHRNLHIYGYDSSYRGGNSHAYDQIQNKMMPTTRLAWAGQEFTVSIAMKHQAEKFQVYAQALKSLGCQIHVYGEGLLQTIYHTPTENLSEQEKYQLLWQYDGYREHSPGEGIVDFFVDTFIDKCEVKGRVIDFGCGTGRAGVKLHERGLEVLLIDFTDNCRDNEALNLPFIQWDLSNEIPVKAEFGLCTDVMEHIPPEDVETVIKNIMDSANRVLFQISTIDDVCGAVINAPLHLTVKPHEWWRNMFKDYTIEFDADHDIASIFYVSHRKKAA